MASGIVIVKQYERMVVLKWGRLDHVAAPGFRFLMPIIYIGRSVDVREQVVRVPTQKYITRDNVVVDMDFVLYYRVLPDQAEKSVLEVADHHGACATWRWENCGPLLATSLWRRPSASGSGSRGSCR
jgi:regulator of protease activity HflC (stomatin/prohibitin superfamily)